MNKRELAVEGIKDKTGVVLSPIHGSVMGELRDE